MYGTFHVYSLSAVWGHSVDFQNFLCEIFKRELLPQFSSNFNPKLYGKYGSQGAMQAITLFGDLPKT